MTRYSEKFSVGLTGGIGSGKTTVTERFIKLGAGVVDADEVSRSITADGQPAVELIARAFGKSVIRKPGVLNRGRLREIVFAEKSKKKQLEQILHPLIRKRMVSMAEELDTRYLIFSIPLLFESGQQSSFDRILVVNAPDVLRINWIRKRSGLTDSQIQKIMDAQISSAERLGLADDVINNNDTLEHVYEQVDKLHLRYLSLAQGSSFIA